jgi:hypothetical protein
VILRPRIVSEYSAQRRSHPPNPVVKNALAVLQDLTQRRNLGVVADVGCGKLRHYVTLRRVAKKLLLVDTDKQLKATHHDSGAAYSIPAVAQSARRRGLEVFALTIEEFSCIKIAVDIAFAIAVFDVVLRKTRQEIAMIVADKLRDGGYFAVIVPRNDSTITSRCVGKNRYRDGHVFSHHGLQTFFCNFRRYDSVIKDCKKAGLRLVRDLSIYRQVCLIFCKGKRN